MQVLKIPLTEKSWPTVFNHNYIAQMAANIRTL